VPSAADRAIAARAQSNPGGLAEFDRTGACSAREIVPGSLSIAGQTIEAIVPIANLPSAEAELAQENVRVDLVTSRQVVD
jgi:hypothetical protein